MPCYAQDISDHHKIASFKENQEKTSKLEALLCSACTALEEKEFNFATNPELDCWWDNHKKIDTARNEADAKKRLLRSKCVELSYKQLTKEDLELLNSEGLRLVAAWI